MSEQQEKKVVRRSVAIALGIICIILIAGLGVVIAHYTTVINDNDRNITSLTDTLNLREYAVLATNQTINQAAGSYTSWKFIANSTGYVFVDVLSSTTNDTYVRLIYNTTIPTYSLEGSIETNYRMVYRYEGAWYFYQYDDQVNIGKKFSSNVFPIFPWLAPSDFLPKGPTIVEIRVGNINTIDNATEHVTIIYYY